MLRASWAGDWTGGHRTETTATQLRHTQASPAAHCTAAPASASHCVRLCSYAIGCGSGDGSACTQRRATGQGRAEGRGERVHAPLSQPGWRRSGRRAPLVDAARTNGRGECGHVPVRGWRCHRRGETRHTHTAEWTGRADAEARGSFRWVNRHGADQIRINQPRPRTSTSPLITQQEDQSTPENGTPQLVSCKRALHNRRLCGVAKTGHQPKRKGTVSSQRSRSVRDGLVCVENDE